MRERFGSKRRAKEEILARYVSLVYMGHGQYGFARAAEHYFGQPLSTFTADDVDKAALLASIPKAPRDYAPAENNPAALRRRDQVLALMAAGGVLSPGQLAEARRTNSSGAASPCGAAVVVVGGRRACSRRAQRAGGRGDRRPAPGTHPGALDRRRQVQRIASEALEHGLERYERRRPRATGLVQGAVVVLRNRDGSILAEAGGRQVYHGRADHQQRLQPGAGGAATARIDHEAVRVPGRAGARRTTRSTPSCRTSRSAWPNAPAARRSGSPTTTVRSRA